MHEHDASICYHRYSNFFQVVRPPFNPHMITSRHVYSSSFGYTDPIAPSPRYQQHPQALLTGSSPNFKNQWWYPDSGASYDVTPDASNLFDFVSLPGSNKVFMGNGQSLNMISIGFMIFILPNISLTIHNLLLVPHITKNLHNLSKFAQDKNVLFKFHPQVCLVKSWASSEVLLHGTIGADGLYKFINFTSPLTNSLSSCTSPTTSIVFPYNFNSGFNCKSNSVSKCNCISLCNDDHINNNLVSSITHVTNGSLINNTNFFYFYNATTFIFSNKYYLWHTCLGHPHHNVLPEVKLCNIHTPPNHPMSYSLHVA